LAANRGLELAQRNGADREIRFCAARVLELSGQLRRKEFLDALDGAILAYPDDAELWIWRGKTCGQQYGLASGDVEAIPFQLAAHQIAPEHPGPSHELVHLYEAIQRPELGWPYAEAYRRSAPNMPHAQHMMAHLAMRLGRWREAVDCTRASREKSLAGFPELDPSHHVDILIRVLAHEGRFREAEAEPQAYRDGLPWARLLQLKADPADLRTWALAHDKSPEGKYVNALVTLDDGDMAGCAPLVAELEKQFQTNPLNFYRYHEVLGRYLIQTGQVVAGLTLLNEGTDASEDDYSEHS
jgi:hypothetical protein